MKKMTFLWVCLFALNVTVWASNDKPIKIAEMPGQAQAFIKNYFSTHSVALAKMETDFLSKSYDVIFTNGDKVEFDKQGRWTNIDCEHSVVPVGVIPQTIKDYVQKQYPNAKILKIELTDRKGYDVGLSNDVEIEFDKRLWYILSEKIRRRNRKALVKTFAESKTIL